jgi:hypothetical protein
MRGIVLADEPSYAHASAHSTRQSIVRSHDSGTIAYVVPMPMLTGAVTTAVRVPFARARIIASSLPIIAVFGRG